MCQKGGFQHPPKVAPGAHPPLAMPLDQTAIEWLTNTVISCFFLGVQVMEALHSICFVLSQGGCTPTAYQRSFKTTTMNSVHYRLVQIKTRDTSPTAIFYGQMHICQVDISSEFIAI